MYFTICIPTYNRKDKIINALQSLEKQTFKDFEVIVVDDGSNDDTDKCIEEYKRDTSLEMHYIYKPNGGKHTALNRGIGLAKGIFFIILDSDDTLVDDCLEFFYEKSKHIIANEELCGIMARCGVVKASELKMIGEPFSVENAKLSYIDFHYGIGLSIKGSRYKDCCECIKTKILRNYKFPENIETKFIPEAYVFDQIGIKYKLLIYNNLVKKVEYCLDGITRNIAVYKKQNINGFLLKYKWNIENLLKDKNIGIFAKSVICYQYFNALDIKKQKPEYDFRFFFGGLFIERLYPLLKYIRNNTK